MSGLVLKLSCVDAHGIVARVSNYIADFGGNLHELNQFSDRDQGKFFARFEIETPNLSVDTQTFIDGFREIGDSLNAEWHFRELPYKMKTALLVTKTDHCLNEILAKTEIGEIPIEITSIIGNRDHCEHLSLIHI